MSESLNDIIELYVRGEASESQQERLRNAIDNDETLLEQVYKESLFENNLNTYYSKNTTEDVMRRVVKACGTPPTRSHRRRKSKQVRRHHLLRNVSTALAVLSVLVLGYLVTTIKNEKPAAPITITTICGNGLVYQITDRTLQELSHGDTLSLGTRLWVGSGSEAYISYADGTNLIIQPDTRLEFHETNNSKLVIVDKGHVHADVAKQPVGAPMLLRSRHAEVTVVGTSFDFRVNEKASKLDVSEGVVRFGNKLGDTTTVTAGEAAKVSAKGKIEPIEIYPNVDAPYSWAFRVSDKNIDEWFGTLCEGSGPGTYALLAAPRDAGEHHTVRSGDYWHYPTFRVHEDSTIKMRIKTEREGFWHMFLLVQKKSASLKQTTAIMELKPKMPEDYEPGEWVDLSFSVKDVEGAVRTGDREMKRSEINGFFCFKFFIDSQKRDIGLAIESFEICGPKKKCRKKHQVQPDKQ